jgi:hypothetical protein
MTTDLTGADASLRVVVEVGDAHDVRQAVLGVLYANWVPFHELVNRRLKQWSAFQVEVVDRAVEAVYLAALAIARGESHETASTAWVRKFLERKISGYQLLVGYVGDRKRGLVSQIYIREAQHAAAEERFSALEQEDVDGFGATRLSFVAPDVALERKEEAQRLNAALEHLDPEGRFALALLYDVGGTQGVTDPRRRPQDRERELRALLAVFRFKPPEVSKIARRFKERVRELDSYVQAIDDSDPRKKRDHDGVWTQRQIAALLDRSEDKISKLVSSSRVTLARKFA